jgi:N utilization substance protein A
MSRCSNRLAASGSGAPVSVLIDHGLDEASVQKLMEGGVSTVERLGSMTPEELEEIPDIDPEMVEKIQLAVNSYYGQFEGSVESPAGEPPPEEAPAEESAAEAVTAGEAAPEEFPTAILTTEPENESVRIDNTESSEPR